MLAVLFRHIMCEVMRVVRHTTLDNIHNIACLTITCVRPGAFVCIEHVTRLECRCPAIGDAGSNVCIDARCPHSLCFLTSSPPISKVHGFSNIASASLVVPCFSFECAAP